MQESMQSLRRVVPRKCTHSFKQLRAFVIKRKPEIFISALQRKKLRGKNGPFKTTNSDNERENGKVSQDKINTKAKDKIKISYENFPRRNETPSGLLPLIKELKSGTARLTTTRTHLLRQLCG